MATLPRKGEGRFPLGSSRAVPRIRDGARLAAGVGGRGRAFRRESTWEACAQIRNTLYLSNHKLLVRACQRQLGSAGVVTLECEHGRTHAPASVPATARRASTLLHRSRVVVRGVCAPLATGPWTVTAPRRTAHRMGLWAAEIRMQ
jgi:hypothetical protein